MKPTCLYFELEGDDAPMAVRAIRKELQTLLEDKYLDITLITLETGFIVEEH